MTRRAAHARRWMSLAGVALASLIASAFVFQAASFEWDIPAPFPRPPVPADNPMNVAKVELGRHLFYDTRLSANNTQSCASCHRQELAFTDGKARAVGATGQRHSRGSMSLANVGYNAGLTWVNPELESLESQMHVPLFGSDPVEMGMSGHEAQFLTTARRDSVYRSLFPRAFPGANEPVSMDNVVKAIAAFERTMVSMRSPYDRYRYGGDTNAISSAAKRGETFFFSGQKGGCFQCHGGWNFNGAVRHEGRPDARAAYFNNGLYNTAGALSYPSSDPGLYRFTRHAGDVGKFGAPTLRNVAVTAPYMHDGSIATLDEVLEHYAAGGRTIASGPHAGVGRDNPNKAPSVHGFAMSDGDKRDLIAFLETLTDTAFLRNPALSNPWKRASRDLSPERRASPRSISR